MQSIKNAVFGGGENTETQSGSEPISGQTGTKTYDAGNESGQTGTTGEYKDTTDAPETTTGTGPTTESHGGYDAGGYNPGITPEASKATDTTNDYTPDTSTTTTDIGAGASTSGITGDSTRAGETTATDTPVADTGASTSETALPTEDTTTTKDDSAAAALKDTDSGPTGEPDVAMGSNAGGAPPRPEHETDKTGVTDLHSNDSKFQTLDQSSANESSVADRGQDKAPIGGVGAVEPSVGAKPESGAAPEAEHQGGGKPTDEPTGEQEDAIVGEKKATEDAMDTGDSGPTDSSENSGQPLGESGDAGAGGPPAAEGEEEDGPNAKSKGTGTGMEYVKSSGVAADGGDFDAANPGAGREADRLMEEAGIKKPDAKDNEPAVDPFADSGDKSGLASKIKDKLHIAGKS